MNSQSVLDFTGSAFGFAALAVFFLAYLAVALEGVIGLKKSKPVILAAGLIWGLVAAAYAGGHDVALVGELVRHNVAEFGELFLFILAAVTYVNTLEERNVFEALRSWLARKRFTLRQVFWITGLLTFFLSAFLDNLTTALVMGAVVIAVGRNDSKFIAVGCINVVVAANAGGAWCPFGDITSLLIWQAGKLEFLEFFKLFIPSAVNWLVPASLMSFTVPKGVPHCEVDDVRIKEGGFVVMGLFALTVVMAVSAYSLLRLPPFLGMMTGLGLLNIYAHVLRKRGLAHLEDAEGLAVTEPIHRDGVFDIFEIMQRIEWDTLMFFYGIILSVGGLAALGYLAKLSGAIYSGVDSTIANSIIGAISAVVDNIPVMFAVLKMNPPLDKAEWLLVALTTGVGGSMLSIGSAAGVALMGQARGLYSFSSHLKWTWAIALGYVLSILVHLGVN